MKTTSSQKYPVLATKLEAFATGLDPHLADAFLDELLALVGSCGHLLCTVADQRTLRVQNRELILCEVPMRLAASKLRSLCARLAVRCREWSDRDVSLYGDEFEIEFPKTKQHRLIRFENKPGACKIELEDVSDEDFCRYSKSNSEQGNRDPKKSKREHATKPRQKTSEREPGLEIL